MRPLNLTHPHTTPSRLPEAQDLRLSQTLSQSRVTEILNNDDDRGWGRLRPSVIKHLAENLENSVTTRYKLGSLPKLTDQVHH